MNGWHIIGNIIVLVVCLHLRHFKLAKYYEKNNVIVKSSNNYYIFTHHNKLCYITLLLKKRFNYSGELFIHRLLGNKCQKNATKLT